MLYVLVCGSRDWEYSEPIRSKLQVLKDFHGSELRVIQGEAKGADLRGRLAAKALGIPQKGFPADWKQYGKAAGPIRNQEMLDFLLGRREQGHMIRVLAFARPNLATSRGTKDMVTRAREANVEVDLMEKE